MEQFGHTRWWAWCLDAEYNYNEQQRPVLSSWNWEPKETNGQKVIINYKMRNGVKERRVKMEKWEKSNPWRRSHYKRQENIPAEGCGWQTGRSPGRSGRKCVVRDIHMHTKKAAKGLHTHETLRGLWLEGSKWGWEVEAVWGGLTISSFVDCGRLGSSSQRHANSWADFKQIDIIQFDFKKDPSILIQTNRL